MESKGYIRSTVHCLSHLISAQWRYRTTLHSKRQDPRGSLFPYVLSPKFLKCSEGPEFGKGWKKNPYHCGINFAVIHQWAGVNGTDKLLITKSMTMNFYSCWEASRWEEGYKIESRWAPEAGMILRRRISLHTNPVLFKGIQAQTPNTA